MTIKLYDLCGADRAFRFSPACWRTRMALAHKQLDCETVPTLFTEIGGIEDGGQRTLPVLVDEDSVIRESFEIAVYLEKAYPDAPSLFRGEGGGFEPHNSCIGGPKPPSMLNWCASAFSIFMPVWMKPISNISAKAERSGSENSCMKWWTVRMKP